MGYITMFRAHVIETKIRQFVLMKMVPCVSAHRYMACLQQTLAKWMSSTRPAPRLTATPVRALIDEQISIKGSFLPPHCPVTVCARMHCEDGDLWESYAHFKTNADGTVNLTRDHSIGGTYLGCEPMGLFWSLQSAPGAREGLRLRKKNVEVPYVVLLSLLEGHVSPSVSQGTELAAVTAERSYMAPGVQRIEIRKNSVIGTLFLPPGPGPFPAMLDLWGMGGGLVEYRSAMFASKGYASLSLAYFGHKDLPGPQNRVNVGDSYFKAAFQLLQDHHKVCADKVGVIGLSFGVYVTLRIATRTGVKPSCLICINGPVGSSLSLPDGDGVTEDLEDNTLSWTYDDQGRVTFKVVSLPALLLPENKVKVEDIECPLMYIEGKDDQNSASKENADMIEETLKAAGKSHLFTRLSYPGAGHLIEPPYAPNARMSLWRVKPEKLFVQWGGHPAPHAAAQEDSWKKMLAFMENHLR
ncbi:bile acid-CoA:amino acid N-acyltransferase-like isoform X2 [Notolabrus celidotus]|uniref:bile acid-CoA:amino acid N-acyltransferase-like isoform X2 n=1 Tax=Notolabrus celidotus TaxID=1203425 RepID=UPI00149004F7|nr:bile acid-CoA:amino acid N-acyltransferase-like isoform X2 [Notolabrus celidotus]